MFRIRYTNIKGELVAPHIWSLKELKLIIKGDAKNSIIEVKMNENMPNLWTNEIIKHNAIFASQH